MAFLLSSPACSDGTVEGGGLVKMAMMSVAACVKKSVIETSEKLIVWGKKVIVSASTSVLVAGR